MLGLALLAQPSFKKLPSGAKHLPFSRWYEFPVLKTALNLKPTAAERRETGLLVRATDDNLLGHFQKLVEPALVNSALLFINNIDVVKTTESEPAGTGRSGVSRSIRRKDR
jgi:hypothetical protein